MYHKLFDSSLKMSIGKRSLITVPVRFPCQSLPVAVKNMRCLPAAFHSKRKPDAPRMQRLNLPELVEQGKRADIIQDIIAVLTVVFDREMIPIPILQVTNAFCLITSDCIFM